MPGGPLGMTARSEVAEVWLGQELAACVQRYRRTVAEESQSNLRVICLNPRVLGSI
jgi:hypothetical protein